MGDKLNASIAALKGRERCLVKYIEKYELNAQKLAGILRCSFIFDDINDLQSALLLLSDYSNQHTVSGHSGDNPLKCKIVRIKDRFITDPLDNKYSDLLVNVRWNNVVCEIQFHLSSLYAVKKKFGHGTYVVARRFGNAFDTY